MTHFKRGDGGGWFRGCWQRREQRYGPVVRTVLLYGSESWVVTGAMLKVLEGFHHWAARQITGMTTKGVADGSSNIPRWRRHQKHQAYAPYRSTFRDGRRPLRNKLYASPYMSSIPRQGGRREDLDNEMVGLGCGTWILVVDRESVLI